MRIVVTYENFGPHYDTKIDSAANNLRSIIAHFSLDSKPDMHAAKRFVLTEVSCLPKLN